jgi:hypothetical protein
MRTGFVASLLVLALASPAFAETAFDFSGEMRLRPESRDNADFNGDVDDKQAFIGSRTRLNVKGKVNDGVSVKLTLQDSRRWGEASQVSAGTEAQAVDVFEGYFLVEDIAGSGLFVKGGRQTLVYGDQRLLGHLGWSDNGRTHDAFKVGYAGAALDVDLFYAKEVESGAPSDDSHDDDLTGLYATLKPTEGATLDLYAINWKTAGSATVDGVATAVKGKNVMTYGARVALKGGGFDATAEYAAQTGDWSATATQEAYAFAVKAGYTFDFIGLRLGAEYDFGSGDNDTADTTHKTFVFPFHTNHAQYGFMDYFSWGNMTDLRFGASAKPAAGVSVSVDYHILALADGNDDWLNVVGTKSLFPAVAGSDAVEAGTEIDLTVGWQAHTNLKLTGGYSVFTPGKAVEERNGGKTDPSQWAYLMSAFTF